MKRWVMIVILFIVFSLSATAIIFSPSEYTWNVNNESNFSFDPSKVVFANNGASLNPQKNVLVFTFQNASGYFYNSSEFFIMNSEGVVKEEIISNGFSLQPGTNGYDSAEGTKLDHAAPDSTFGWDKKFLLKEWEDKETRYLLRFRNIDIPLNTTITSAVLEMYTDNTRVSGGSLMVYQMGKDWTSGTLTDGRINHNGESGATWDYAILYHRGLNNSQSWQLNGSSGDQDRNPIPLDTQVKQAGANWISLNVTSAVQAWQNGAPNYGLLLQSDSVGIPEVLGIRGNNHEHRPRLRINYELHTIGTQKTIVVSPFQNVSVRQFTSFITNVSATGSVTYQLSIDNKSWKYFNGVNWISASNDAQANTAAQVHTHIPKLLPNTGIQWRAIILPQNSTVIVKGVTVGYDVYHSNATILAKNAVALGMINASASILVTSFGNVSVENSLNNGSWSDINNFSLINNSLLQVRAILKSDEIGRASCRERV